MPVTIYLKEARARSGKLNSYIEIHTQEENCSIIRQNLTESDIEYGIAGNLIYINPNQLKSVSELEEKIFKGFHKIPFRKEFADYSEGGYYLQQCFAYGPSLTYQAGRILHEVSSKCTRNPMLFKRQMDQLSQSSELLLNNLLELNHTVSKGQALI